MGTLANLCSNLHLPRSVKEQTAVFYRKALKKGLVRGRSIEGIMGACLYAACRSMRVHRSLKEISIFLAYKTNELAKCYRLVNIALNLDVPQIKAQNLVPKIAGKCDIETSIQRDAIEILREAGVRKVTAGKSPSGLAAGALYIACKQNDAGVIQKDIAYAAGVTEVTIRNRYKGLVQGLDLQMK
jgi:transcription initiation factor TFIIB